MDKFTKENKSNTLEQKLLEKIEDAIWEATDEGTFEYGTDCSATVSEMANNVLKLIKFENITYRV